MRSISIANAGVSLDFGGKRIWVDALHTENEAHYSVVTEAMQERMFSDPDIANPDLILFTHPHNDHFSKELTEKALGLFPNAKFMMVCDTGIPGQVVISGDVQEFTFGDLKVTFFKLVHEGKKYGACPHYGILLEADGKKILFPGDSRVASEELYDFLKSRDCFGKDIDTLFLNFPWVALSTGRASADTLNAKHTIFFHMPFEEDDSWGYRKQVLKLLDKYKEDRDWRVFKEAFQVEEM